MRAAEELEHLYEKKLAAEAARFEAMRMEKEDMQSQVTAPAYLSVHTCSHRSPHMQRSEIRRLREHVHQLVARTSDGGDDGENGGGGGGAERPHTSHAPDRGLAVSEDVPRPTSSFR